MPGAEMVYRLSNREHGVLLLHGYLGSPFEMKSLSQKIFEEGYSVYVPRYPGHGTSIEDMTTTYGRDWFCAAREAYIELRSQCREVSVIGLSMGAAFAVLLAREFDIGKIGLLSMPAGILNHAIYLTPILKHFKKILYRSDVARTTFNKGINDPEARSRHVGYFEGIPIAQAWELYKIIQQAMAALPFVHGETLIIQSHADDTIPPRSLEHIEHRIGSRHTETLWLDRSNHAITVDYDRELVGNRVLSFLKAGAMDSSILAFHTQK